MKSSRNKFYQFGKHNNFFKNINNFLLITLPVNLVVFLLLMGAYLILYKFSLFPTMQIVLKPYNCLICLWTSLFADNMTYLSFHCFFYFYGFVPYAHGISNLLSCLLCLLTTYILLMMCFLGFAVRIFIST